MKTAKLIVVFLAIASVIIAAIPAYCQDKKAETISISGEVVSVAVEQAEITVKQLKDPAMNTYSNISVTVAPETKIVKAGNSLQLSDLKAGDKVTVNTLTDASGKTTTESITVE